MEAAMPLNSDQATTNEMTTTAMSAATLTAPVTDTTTITASKQPLTSLTTSNPVTLATTIKTTKTIPTTAQQKLPIELLQNSDQKRRSSSRSIKRKRFDDEIVEYSTSFPQRGGGNDHQSHRNARQRNIAQTYLAIVPPPPVVQPQILAPPTTTTTSISTVEPAAITKTLSVAASITTDAAAAAVTGLQASITTATATTTTTNIVSSNTILGSNTNNNNASLATTALIPTITQAPATQVVHTMERANTNATERRRAQRTHNSNGNKRARRNGRPPTHITTKDLGRWKPIDDLALAIGVQQTNDLRLVHRGVKFSCKFTVQELQARWYSLLFEPAISRIAVSAMKNLHPELIESVQRKALFSVQEEELLGTIKSGETPKLEHFQELLDKNSSVFYSARNAKSLHNHWMLMKQYSLLPDQTVKPPTLADPPMSFSDAEEQIFDADLHEQRDEALEIELALADRQNKRQIRLLENELSRWGVLVDSVLGPTASIEFDNQTLACLRGRLVRYLMRSKEITFGREAKDCVVDVDLTLEGAAAKISRRQGTIKLRSNGDFFISNEGKRAIFIDGHPLLQGNKTRLAHNCTVEIAGLSFAFLVNYELINAIRQESAKTPNPLN